MSLPKCLTDIVGSREPLNNLPSAFGLYVEQHPGISAQMISAITPTDYLNSALWLKDIFENATNEFISELEEEFRPRFRFNGMLDGFSNGRTPKSMPVYKTASAFNRGIRYRRNNPDVFGLFVVNKVNVLISNTGEFTLNITDSNGFNQDYPFISIGGTFTEVVVDYRSDAGEIFITLNPTGTGLMPPETLPADLTLQDGCGSCHHIDGDNWRAEGWDGEKTANSTFGIQAVVVVRCDENQIACMFRENRKFQQALWYKFGATLLTHAIFSDRANPKTIHKVEQNEINRQEMEDKMDDLLVSLRETSIPFLAKRHKCISFNQPFYQEGSVRRML